MKLKEQNGEHPLGDAGQLIVFGVFMVIWSLDSFILHRSTFLADNIPLAIRLIFLGAALAAAFYLFKSGHVVVSGDQRATEVVSTGAFRYVRHPLYWDRPILRIRKRQASGHHTLARRVRNDYQ
jgi:protein-S-isoprenylcysteine O-methyltransferase Ste14